MSPVNSILLSCHLSTQSFSLLVEERKCHLYPWDPEAVLCTSILVQDQKRGRREELKTVPMQLHPSDMPVQPVLHVTPYQAETEAKLNPVVKTPDLQQVEMLFILYVKALIEKTKII